MELVADGARGAGRRSGAGEEVLRLSAVAEPMRWVAYALGAATGALLVVVPAADAPPEVRAVVHATGALLVLVAAASAAFELVSTLPPAAHLRLHRGGVEVRQLGRSRTVPWSAVASFRVVRVLHGRAVAYDLAPWRRHLRVVGCDDEGPVGLLPPVAGVTPEALVRKLEAWRVAAMEVGPLPPAQGLPAISPLDYGPAAPALRSGRADLPYRSPRA